MKSFVKLAAAAAVALSASAHTAFADDATVKFGVAAEPYPPFTVKDPSGKWTGWEADLMEAVCKKAALKCEFVETAWDGIIPALTSKKIDVIWSSMSITAERAKTIDFTDMYYNAPAFIIGKKDGDKDITPAHLKGKTLGVQTSTTHEKYVQKYFAPAGAVIKIYQTQDEDDQDLAAGRLDYVQADSLTLADFLKTDAAIACCELKGVAPDDPEVLGSGAGGGVRKEDTELKGKINAAIHALGADGTIAKLNDKYKLSGQIITPAK